MRMRGVVFVSICLIGAGIFIWENGYPPENEPASPAPSEPNVAAESPQAVAEAAAPQAAPPAETEAAPPPETENAKRRLELPYAKHTDSLNQKQATAKAPKEALETVRFRRPLPTDAGTLRSGDTTIRLAGIEALGIDSDCRLPSGKMWPCSRSGTFALRRLIRARSIVCDIFERLDANTVTARCTVAGIDINEWIVRRGWGRPAPDAETEYADAFKAAQSSKNGQWREKTLPTVN